MKTENEMKYLLRFIEWVKKSEAHSFAMSWAAIAILFALLVISRTFYSTDIQTVGYGGYSFLGEVQQEAVHYTVRSVPEGSETEIGQKATVEKDNSSHITYRGQLYISKYVTFYKEMTSVTFPDQISYIYMKTGDGKGVWMDAENTGNMVQAMSKQPDSSWQPDLIIALHFADDTFRENVEHPKEWDFMWTLLALLCLLEGTAFAFCPKMIGNLVAKRDRRFWYDSDSEIRPSQRLINWYRAIGYISILVGLFFLYRSFYFYT